ncbi:nicotinamide N-methyltransferase [Mycena crocata]|nr:nicotinamide N-methyltransferase [Mycena crocata]
MSDDESELALGSMFPEEPRPPTPEATVEVYTRDEDVEGNDWREMRIRLVGAHPLWGHHLWNAARAFASYLDHNRLLYQDKCVLELGAGGGLPGLVAAKNGAKHVVLTDYPDADLVKNMVHNVSENDAPEGRISVLGYIWGQPVQPLLTATKESKFELIIMSDLVFNHSQHNALLTTCTQTLAQGGAVLVFYTHHRPHLAHRDMEFFSKARDRGWTCEEVLTRRYKPMFPEDSGEESVRATVHGWLLRLE